MSNRKTWKWVLIIALIVLIVVIVVLLVRRAKNPEDAKQATDVKVATELSVDADASLQKPALNEDWLELPGAVNNDDYEVKTYYDSSVRNYTHLYDKETYTSL